MVTDCLTLKRLKCEARRRLKNLRKGKQCTALHLAPSLPAVPPLPRCAALLPSAPLLPLPHCSALSDQTAAAILEGEERAASLPLVPSDLVPYKD